MFDVEPLTGSFGAEVRGVDIAAPLEASAQDAIRKLLGEHKVLVFPEQHAMGAGEQVAFAQRFGTPEWHHPFYANHPDHPGVNQMMSTGDGSQIGDDTWHTDGCTREKTPFISVLRPTDIPDRGRDTMYADMEAALHSLSPAMQAFLGELRAVHEWPPFAAQHRPDLKPIDHPVVITSAVTRRRALYVNPFYTTSIVGLKRDESRALLQMLFAKAHIPEFQLRVRWRPGTVVMWDNESTQHYLVQDYRYDRWMERVMVMPPGLD